jgi:hypothetical protein
MGDDFSFSYRLTGLEPSFPRMCVQHGSAGIHPDRAAAEVYRVRHSREGGNPSSRFCNDEKKISEEMRRRKWKK